MNRRAVYLFLIIYCCCHLHVCNGQNATLYSNKLPQVHTCMAARMEYSFRNPSLPRQRADAVHHYETIGHSSGLTWRGELCDVDPVYQHDPICQCDSAINYYIMDNPLVSKAEAYGDYLQQVETGGKMWHCGPCLIPSSKFCVSARYDYSSRYLSNFSGGYIEPLFHYLTLGKYNNNTWNETKCQEGKNVFMDQPEVYCPAAEQWYIARVPDYNNLMNGGERTGQAHYKRYSMEYGAYWNADICIDFENECLTGNHNCTSVIECINEIGPRGSFRCGCNTGYGGPRCEDINECEQFNCTVNSTCVNTIGGYYCKCNYGYKTEGTECIDVDECELGTDRCDSTAVCVNLIGSYECVCPSNFRWLKNTCAPNCPFPNFSCPDGRCVNLENETCADPHPCIYPNLYRCDQSECSNSPLLCQDPLTNCNGSVVCWDGSCAETYDSCPVLPRCPALTKRCPDGSCRDSCGDITCNAPLKQCKDGMCASNCTSKWNGCPLSIPFMCPDGACIADVANCYNTPTIRVQRPAPVRLFIPTTTSQQDFSFNVYSQEEVVVAVMTLNTALFKDQNATILINDVPDSVVYEAGETRWGADFEPNSKLFSAAIEIVVIDGTSEFNPPIIIDFNFNMLYSNYTAYCLAVINEQHEWECHSKITKDSNGDFVYGNVTRTGKFAIAAIDDYYKREIALRDRITAIYIIAALIMLYCIALVFASLRDRRIFIEIVSETIKRETSVYAEFPAQIETIEENTESSEIEGVELQRVDMARRGASIANIVIPDELRARHMALTKHAVVLSTKIAVDLPTGDRSTRAMTFDAPYSPFFPPTPSHSLVDFTKPRSRTRGYSVARPSLSDEPHVTFALHEPTTPRSALKRSQSSRANYRSKSAHQIVSKEQSGIFRERALRKPSSRNLASPNSGDFSRNLTRKLTSKRNLVASPTAEKFTSNRNLLSSSRDSENEKKFTSSRNFTSYSNLGLGATFASSMNFKYEEDKNNGAIKIELEEIPMDDDDISSPTPLLADLGIESDLSSSEDAIASPQEIAPTQEEWDESVRAQLGEVDVKKVSLWDLLKLKHSWVSVWTTHRTSRITNVEHLTIITCMVLGTLGLSAPFFDNNTTFNVSESVQFAVATSALVFIATFGLTLLFQNVTRIKLLRLVFALAFAFCSGCIVLAIVYSYYYDTSVVAVMWLFACIVAILQDLLINQPFKVLVTALVYAKFPDDHWLVLLL